MEDDNSGLTRRTALKGIGAAALAGGVGAMLSSGSAGATMASSFTATNPTAVTNDDGNLSEVSVNPRVYTSWENFDEEPMKLRYVLEAGIEGQGYTPVYRETPWLFSDETAGNDYGGTTGRYPESGRVPLASKNSDFYTINGNNDFVDPDDGSQIVPPKVVLFKEGYQMPTYTKPDGSDFGGGSAADHLDGSSLGDDSGAYANGNYGVLGDTSALDADTDGTSKATKIYLRLTTALLKLNSESVMQEEYPVYSGSAGYTYGRLRDIAGDHPGVSVSTASFTVTAQNEVAGSGTDGSANPSAN